MLLGKAPKNSFDQVYLGQQVEAHRSAWAVETGYADEGTDAALKQVAAATAPIVDAQLTALATLAPTGM